MGKKRPFVVNKASGITVEAKRPTNPGQGQQQPQPPQGKAALARAGSGGSSKEVIGADTDIPDYPHERLLNRAFDEKTFKAAVAEWEKIHQIRRSLRQANLSPNYEAFEELRRAKKLDSTLKKCTAFVKKIKSYSSAQKESLFKELPTLNLTQFVSEIAAAVTESKWKYTELYDMLHICSLLHQRYQKFAEELLECYQRVLPHKRSEMSKEPYNIHKLAQDLRMCGELILVGVLDNTDSSFMLHSSIRNLMLCDREAQLYVKVMTATVRGLADDFGRFIPVNIQQLQNQFPGIDVPHFGSVIPPPVQKAFFTLFNDYTTLLGFTLGKLHDEVLRSEKYNRKLMKTRGEIPQDRKNSHDEIAAKCDALHALAKKVANVTGGQLPELIPLPPEPEPKGFGVIVFSSDSGEAQTASGKKLRIFPDENTRAFYQDFPDLRVYLPQNAYKEAVKAAEKKAEEICEREKQMTDMNEEIEALDLQQGVVYLGEDDPVTIDPDAEAEEAPSPSPAPAPVGKVDFQTYLKSFLKFTNRKMVDQAAIDFVDHYNNGNNRKALLKYLFHIPRQRVDLIPLWSRLVAILASVIPSLAHELCEKLFKEFKYRFHQKHQQFLETKLKITNDFTFHHIDMACALVETCGRILHRTPDSHPRMNLYLHEMKRRMGMQTNVRYKHLIENALICVFPTIKVEVKQEKPEPMPLFIRTLLLRLNRKTLPRISLTFRRFNWKDPKTIRLMTRAFSEPQELAFQQLPAVASLVKEISKFQPKAITTILHEMLEIFHDTMKITRYQMNKPRVVMAAFLAELYNYGVFESDTIFGLLYSFLTEGVTTEVEQGYIDQEASLIRIRQACMMIKIVMEFYRGGEKKTKLTEYLNYLQQYYWHKRSLPHWVKTGFPLDVVHLVEDTIVKFNSRIRIARSYEESVEIVNAMERKVYRKNPKLIHLRTLLEKNVLANLANAHPEMFGRVRERFYYNKFGERISAEEKREQVRLEREYDQMMSEAKHVPKVVNADIPVPMLKKDAISKPESVNERGEKMVGVAVLTKKGNKQVFKTVSVPAQTVFLENVKRHREAEAAERAQMKQLTLGISRLQMAEEEAERKKRVQEMQGQLFKK